MRFQKLLLSVVALLLMMGCVPAALAQSAGTGALTGTVSDPSGGAIPGVTVTITNTETNQTRTTTTTQDGLYKFTLLPPGSYKVKFVIMGFKAAEVGPVTVNVT